MEWESRAAVVVTHAPARFRASLALIFFGIVSIALPLAGLVSWSWAIASAVSALAGALAAIRLSVGTIGERGRRVTAGARGIEVDGALVLAPGAVAYGFVEPARDAALAVVKIYDRTHGLRLELRVESVAEGQAALRALGVDVDQRAATFFLASPLAGLRSTLFAGGAFVASFLALGALLRLIASGALSPVVDDAASITVFAFPALYFLAWAVLSSVATRATIGADGLHTSWLGKKRFVSYREIDRVVPAFGQLRVVLKDGRSLLLRAQRRSFSAATRPEHRALMERMRAAIADHVARDRVREAQERVPKPREEAGVAAWLRELRALDVGAESGYRRAVVSDEALWRVVEDPTAEESARAGAAVALGKVLDDAGRARLRVAADASASPRLRGALTAAAGEDEGQLEEALEELASPEQRRAARVG